jgi:hypothetical protein
MLDINVLNEIISKQRTQYVRIYALSNVQICNNLSKNKGFNFILFPSLSFIVFTIPYID